jgi:hypothetical protein
MSYAVAIETKVRMVSFYSPRWEVSGMAGVGPDQPATGPSMQVPAVGVVLNTAGIVGLLAVLARLIHVTPRAAARSTHDTR